RPARLIASWAKAGKRGPAASSVPNFKSVRLSIRFVMALLPYQGAAISFYIRPPSLRRGPLAHGQRREGRLVTTYWSGNGYNYALVSAAATPGVHIIHHASWWSLQARANPATRQHHAA